MTKLLENIFRSVNIALVNELAILADRMGIDIWEVVDAASTKPYGFMRFEPGPGMGGHCLPVDPFYLTWRAREFHMSTEFIELAGKINQQMPYHCVERIERALNDADQAGQGLADRDPRRQLQGRRRRHPRVARAADHGGARRARREARPTTTRTSPRSPSSGLENVRSELPCDERRRGRAGHRPPRHRLRGDRRARVAVHRPARRHPRRDAANLVRLSGPRFRRSSLPRPELARRTSTAQSRRISPSRARSSVGERSLHTREVAGSSPAVPIKKPW